MSYTEFLKIIGYHATSTFRAMNIKSRTDFKASESKEEWLGKGVYFWDELINAKWWSKVRKFYNHRRIFKCQLECNDIYFLDLDKTEDCTIYKNFINKFESYVDKLSYELKERSIDYKFKSEKEIRCFYLDAFKELNKIKMIGRSFDVEGGIGADDGIVLRRRQICVTDNYQSDVIKSMEIYYE
ncbi:hypothetical protein [Anaerococcus lactolyticus]|uniref:Uncharacterized protein n=1 Tax=Anaerococcus lactolyticus S7-1-13 TaxID=1284686 RepID=A0A095X029_9FIRM|nr:hypothetical protein [Anaerococcus lactolyticus]KGF03410.1 hypothetical protein HMPREF1630_07465 [Anaerococcus lactolyticus S7-1-13]